MSFVAIRLYFCCCCRIACFHSQCKNNWVWFYRSLGACGSSVIFFSFLSEYGIKTTGFVFVPCKALVELRGVGCVSSLPDVASRNMWCDFAVAFDELQLRTQTSRHTCSCFYLRNFLAKRSIHYVDIHVCRWHCS